MWEARLAAIFLTVCKTETIAPHIRVLTRDIPHILCIIAARRASHKRRASYISSNNYG